MFIFSRENRSLPGNENLSGESVNQHVGDLIVNLVEILPVRIF